MKFAEIIVPTIDTTRNEYLVKLMILRGRHVLITGETGTGKSVSTIELVDGKLMRKNTLQFLLIFQLKPLLTKHKTLLMANWVRGAKEFLARHQVSLQPSLWTI